MTEKRHKELLSIYNDIAKVVNKYMYVWTFNDYGNDLKLTTNELVSRFKSLNICSHEHFEHMLILKKQKAFERLDIIRQNHNKKEPLFSYYRITMLLSKTFDSVLSNMLITNNTSSNETYLTAVVGNAPFDGIIMYDEMHEFFKSSPHNIIKIDCLETRYIYLISYSDDEFHLHKNDDVVHIFSDKTLFSILTFLRND